MALAKKNYDQMQHESVGVVIKVVNTESNRVDGRIFYKNGDHHKFMALVQATVHGELFSIVCYDNVMAVFLQMNADEYAGLSCEEQSKRYETSQIEKKFGNFAFL